MAARGRTGAVWFCRRVIVSSSLSPSLSARSGQWPQRRAVGESMAHQRARTASRFGWSELSTLPARPVFEFHALPFPSAHAHQPDPTQRAVIYVVTAFASHADRDRDGRSELESAAPPPNCNARLTAYKGKNEFEALIFICTSSRSR